MNLFVIAVSCSLYVFYGCSVVGCEQCVVF